MMLGHPAFSHPALHHPAATHMASLLPCAFPPRSPSRLHTCCPFCLDCASQRLCLQTSTYPSKPYSMVTSSLRPSMTVRPGSSYKPQKPNSSWFGQKCDIFGFQNQKSASCLVSGHHSPTLDAVFLQLCLCSLAGCLDQMTPASPGSYPTSEQDQQVRASLIQEFQTRPKAFQWPGLRPPPVPEPVTAVRNMLMGKMALGHVSIPGAWGWGQPKPNQQSESRGGVLAP